MMAEEVREKDRAKIEATTHPHAKGRKLVWKTPPDARLLKGRSMMVGVNKLRYQGEFTKNLLVIGTGRCGTTWLSKTLLEAGFDVPHECVGESGTVSMFFHSDADWYPYLPWVTDHPGRKAHIYERRSDFEFDHVAHIVRHPLETEASMRSILNQMEFYWAQDSTVLTVPWDLKPAKLRNLFYWRDVVTLCERLAAQTIPLNRVDESDKWWDTLLVESNLCVSGIAPMRPRLPPNNKSSGFKKHEPMTWSEVDALDAELGKDLRRICRRLKLED